MLFTVTEPAREALETATAGIDPFPTPSAWPAELKSPARVVAPPVDAASRASGSSDLGFARPLVAGSLVVALLLGLGSFRDRATLEAPRASSG